MIKKLLIVLVTCVLGIALGTSLWLIACGGTDILKKIMTLPEKPQGTATGYYYKNLEDTEKIAYELITQEIEEMPEKIRVPKLDNKELSDVFEALLYDNPTYFFLSDVCKSETTGFGTCYFMPEYTMSKSEYLHYMEELEGVKDIIIERTSGLTDVYEKELFLHDYIVEKCEYVEKTGGTYSSVYGCLVKGSASCEGYAKAMKYLMDESGVDNYIAVGTTESENSVPEGHAWNIVEIDDNYYHVDVTWDDPVENSVENRYAYFNVTDEEISETHDVEERFLGKCTEDDENYYVKNSMYFSSYDNKTRDAIVSEIAKQASVGKNYMSFKMADKKSLEDAEDALFDMNGIYDILHSASIMTVENVTQNKVMYAVDEKHRIIVITDFIE